MAEENEQQQVSTTEESTSLGPISLNAGPLTLSSSSGTGDDLQANLRLFQNSTTIAPGTLQFIRNGDNYSVSYSGGLPLSGNFGPIQTEGLTANSISASNNGLQNISISAGSMKIGENFKLNGITASLAGGGGNFEVTANSATGNIMGHVFTVNAPTVVIDGNGNFVEANFTEYSAEGITVSGGKLTPTGLSIASAGVNLPEIYGQTLSANFTNLTLNSSGYSGTGTISQESELKLVNNSLTVSNFTGTANIQSNAWSVNLQGNLNYAQEGLTANANASLGVGPEGTTFSVSEGSISGDFNGITMTGEGLSYDSTTDQVNMTTGTAKVPILGGELEGTLTGANYSASGFNFESVALSTNTLDLFPGMQMSVQTATLSNVEGNYTFALENGTLTYTSAAVTGSGSISIWYDNQGLRGTIVNPMMSTNLLDASAEGEISFSDTGISIPSATITLKNLGAPDANLGVTATGIEYNSTGLNVNGLNITLPEVAGIQANAIIDNIAISDAGMTATGGRIESTGSISLAGGALTVDSFTSLVNVSELGWDVSASGTLNTALPNTTASGDLKVSFGSTTENALQLENGSVSTEFNGISVNSEGLTYDSTTNAISMTSATAETTVKDTKVSGTIQGASFGETGFDFAEVTVNAEGPTELLPGLTVPTFTGQLKKNEAGELDVELSGAVNFSSATLTGGATNVTYRKAGTEESLSIEGLNVDSNYFSFNADSATYANDTLDITSSNFNVKNLGAVGDAATVSAGSIQWNSSGLTINNLDASLPQIGDVGLSAHADVVQVADAVTIQGGTVNVDGNLSFANGALAINNVAGTFNVAEGGWDASVTGALAVNNVANTTASGNMTIAFGTDGASFNLENGQIQSSLAGLTLTATGISFGTDPSVLTIDSATLEVPELAGGDLNATISQVSFGPEGFQFQSATISSSGSFELLPGFNVSGLSGTLSSEGNGEYGIDANATATVQSAALTGGASIHFTRTGGTSTFEVEQLNLQTSLFDFTVESATYQENKLTVASANLNLKNLGAAADGLQATATDVEYSAEGLKVGHLEADFPQIGNVNVRVLADNLVVPAGGGITGTGTVEVGSEISLAGGAVTLNNIAGTVNLQDNAWGVEVTAGLGFGMNGVTGGGDVTVSYGTGDGVDVSVANGSFNANYAGLELIGTGLNYSYSEDKFGIDSTTVNMPSLGDGGVSTTVDGLSVQDGDVSFNAVQIQINQTIQIIPGMDATLNSGTITKEGESITSSIDIAVALDDSTYGLGGSGRGTLNYDLATNEFTGSLNALNISNSMFRLAIRRVGEISNEGFKVGSVTLSFNENLDPDELSRVIPLAGNLGAMAVNALKGVSLKAKDVEYNGTDGLSVGSWELDFAKISFNVMGLNGEMDLANLTASLSGSKTFDIKDFGFPTRVDIAVPIVAGVNATGGVGIGANLTLGAGITAQGDKDSDVWTLKGNLSASGTLSAYLQLGVEVDALIASGGAALRASINTALNASAGIGMAITYNPQTNSVELADQGLTFDYKLLADIFTALDLVLNYEVMLGLYEDEHVINLSRWDIGSLHLSGSNAADSFSELFSGMDNTAYLNVDGTRYDF